MPLRSLAVTLIALAAVQACGGRRDVATNPPATDASGSVAASPVVQGIVERDSLPGLAVAVLARGKFVMDGARGWADLENRRPVERTTQFRIGSISKLLTIAAAARLVDRGRLDLDAPIGRYLPDLPAPIARITSRQLAGHLGGIRHYGAGEYTNRRRFDRVEASLAHFLDDVPVTEPGARYLYSSYGFNLLGAVLQAASGREFRDLIANEMLTPLGLRQTEPEVSATGPRQARLYQRDSAGTRAADSLDVTDRWPSGGYLSTARDLARFAAGVIDRGYLSDSMRAQLFTSQRTLDGRETGVGLAWRIGTDSLGRRFVHHGGTSNGGRAFVLLYPDDGLSVAVLTNSTPARFATGEVLALAAPYLTPPPGR